jgi:polyribonucleotide nucleotidyltransferase
MLNPQIKKVTVDVGGRPLTLETGWWAKQASGAVIVKHDNSSVLVTFVAAKAEREFDFLPLTVDYMDRTAAEGKIPGGFLKREGRQNERETLISRLIDRPLRPQFYKGANEELQVIATALSYDPSSDTDVLSLVGASAAVAVSDTPTDGIIAGVRVCRLNGELKINPSRAEANEADINLVVAGTREAICMVEGGGREADESSMIDAMDAAHAAIKAIVGAIEELAALVGVTKKAPPVKKSFDAALVEKLKAVGAGPLREAMAIPGKHERRDGLKAARDAAIAAATEGLEPAAVAAATAECKEIWEKMVRGAMRAQVVERGVRLDGRATDEVRDILCEVGVVPRVHGSSLFTRGETQGFVTATIGIEEDAQRIDFAGSTEQFRRWMLQYNFAPFCTGEARMMRGPKRREIGHGALAHRALEAVLPAHSEFPYVLRCVSDILESNGSSSMATVCGASLSLMDAGVPLKAPVAGIAMGLIKEGDQFAVLSDILGDEDHLGDMDFKVTGTRKGVTAFQMDTKITGVPREVMLRAMNQAREGRLTILDEMDKAIAAPRKELSPNAPRITVITINPEKIRDIIGPGGKTIRSIQDRTGTRLRVDDSGRVEIASIDGTKAKQAEDLVRELTQEAEIGKLYLGVVKRTVDFGAFVEIFPGTEGLVHISHLAVERVDRTTDVVREGDEVLVRVIDIDRSGKIRLSRKEALASDL